jgi:aminoglycoside/choline kinase family phosphotransferase
LEERLVKQNEKTRPDRGEAMDAFLHRVGWIGAKRQMLAGDASFRRYERVHHNNAVAVLMDAPPPWEDVRPFQSITAQLAEFGLSVPTILAADEEAGFLLLEDLGDLSFTKLLLNNPGREREIYLAATDALISINRASRDNSETLSTVLKPYDEAVYLREAGVFAEWFLPQAVGMAKARALQTEYRALWQQVFAHAQPKKNVLVHRDYHADNLFWLDDRMGHCAVGMIDYQDALLGDPAYDLASLLEDARRDVGPQTIADCFARFVTEMGEDARDFADRYVALAAQRNAKIIGIFTRLTVRDNKPHYLKYLPRVWRHFLHDLNHELLAPIKTFVDTHVPAEFRGEFNADISLGGIVP